MTATRFASIAVGAAGVLFALAPNVRAESYAGFRGGVNNAKFTGPDVSETSYPDPRLGFTGGAFVGKDFGKTLGFREELLYTMKGGSGTDSTSIDLDYLEWVSLLVSRFALSPNYSIRAYVGPVIGLWLSAEANTGPYDVDIGEIVKHWELSATIGAEFNAKAGPYILLLDVRYTQGGRIFEDVGLNGEPLDIKVSNSGISVMTGVSVPF